MVEHSPVNGVWPGQPFTMDSVARRAEEGFFFPRVALTAVDLLSVCLAGWQEWKRSTGSCSCIPHCVGESFECHLPVTSPFHLIFYKLGCDRGWGG